MAFTKKPAPAKTSETKVLTAKEARGFFRKAEVHFPNGAKFNITGFEVVQFGRDGADPAPDARRHVVLITNIGELMLSALWTPKYQLDVNNPSKEAVQIVPDGTLTKRLDEIIDAASDDVDIEDLIRTNIEELKKLNLVARRKRFYGLNNFGQKGYQTILNIDIE